MMQSFNRILDGLLGRGAAAVTVPPLDGALKPNNVLEDLPPGRSAADPDNLATYGAEYFWSEGSRILSSNGGAIADLGSEITAMAISMQGQLAVATLRDGVVILDQRRAMSGPTWKRPLRHVTAIQFQGENQLLVCTGSDRVPPTEWARDLMERNASGEVSRCDIQSGAVTELASKLAYPNGIAGLADGDMVVSESWTSRLIRLGADGRPKEIVLDDLPGYPGRITKRANGGFWLAVFAPRSPLIEFVLREPKYRKAMMREVPPQFWVAPAYRSGQSLQEPLQGGALKQMGILKPWAPTRSYGLVVELDANFSPVRSFHSRAGGRRHGVTSIAEHDGGILISSRGGGEVLRMELAGEGKSA